MRHRAVRRVILITLALNLLVAGAKAVYGVWSGSLAITADAAHSLVDAGSNVLALVILRFSAAPPDREHPYGHQKLEVMAAAVVGLAVGVTAVRFAWEAIDALAHGLAAPATSVTGFAVIGSTWAVNLFVAIYEGRAARRLGSEFLAADSAHTASDVLVTVAVLASFTAASAGVSWADPVGALAVIIVIAWVAWRILSRNLGVLAGTAVVDAESIARVARDVSGVRGCHRVRSHGTHHNALVDLHILLDDDLSLREAHDIAHRVEEAIKGEIASVCDVTVHMEPEETGYEGL